MDEELVRRIEALEGRVARLAERRSPVTLRTLTLVTEGGRVCADLSSRDGAAALTLRDERGRPRARLAVEADGGPSLLMAAADGGVRSALGVADDVAPHLRFFDGAGACRLVMGAGPDDAVVLGYDAHGRVRAGLSSHERGGIHAGAAVAPAAEVRA